MMFTLFFGVGWAAETTFALSGYSSDFNYEGETKDGVTLAAAKGSGSSAPKYYTNNDAVRFYIGNTLTISSNNTITKIELTMGKTANVFSPSPSGTNWQGVSANSTATWSGSASSIVFTGSGGQNYIKSIKVTYSEGGTPQPTTYSLTLPTELTGGSVTSNYNGSLTAIPANTSITVTATANTDYELDWMKANGTEVTNPYTFSITGNTTITANFIEQSTPQPSGDYVFYEPFTGSTGTHDSFGGNDGSGTAVYVNTFGDFIATSGTIYGAGDAIKAGANKTKGKVKTPEITGLTVGKTYTLTFKAAPWASESATMSVTATGGTLSGLSTATMTTGQWNDFTATFVASATSATFEFSASKNRFFLDEVKLVEVASDAHSITLTQPTTGGTISSDKLSASADETVTLSVASTATGYEFTSWTVTGDDSGDAITVNSDGTFTMPDEDVTVTATFGLVNYNIYRTVKTNGETSTAGGWLGRWNENCTLPDGATGDSYVVTANYGASIQFMAGTNNNYEILPENITAVDADGNPVSLNVADSYTTIDNDYGRLVTFTMPASPVTITANFTSYVSELYILGTANGNSWAGNLGVQMDKGGTDDAYYTARVYFAGNATDGAYGYFNFTESLGNADWSNMGTRYGSKNGEHYDLEAHGWTGEMNWWDEHKEQSFKVPAGIYDIVVNKVKGQVTVTRVEPEFTFSPAAGEVLEGTEVSATSNLYELLHAIDSSIDENGVNTKVSLSEDGTYADNVTLATTGNATVYAKAFYGQITYTSAPAAYTVEEVDMNNVYVLVEDADDLVAGEDYLIARSNGEAVLGAIASGNYGTSVTEGFAYNPTAKTITLQTNCDATPLTLGGEENAWTFYNGTQYLALTGNGNSLYGVNTIPTNNSQAEWTISITEDVTNILNNEYTNREIQYNSSQPRFACYTGTHNAVALFKKAVSKVVPPSFSVESGEVVAGTQVTITAGEGCTLKYTVNNGTEQTTTGNTATVTINEATTIVAKAVDGDNKESVEVTATYTILATTTLANLEANPVEGESYLISDELTVGYVAGDGTAYAKDADQNIEVPSGANDYVATMLTDRNHTNKTANWIAITGIDEVSEGQTITANTLRGTLTDAVNFTLAVSQQPELSSRAGEYDLNTYIPCNFTGDNTQEGTNGYTYFFSTPQVNEFAHITNAVLASKTSGTSGEAGTYTMTIDSGKNNGENNVHWTANNSTLTWDDVSWNASYTDGNITNQNKWIQIGSQSNPSTQIVLTTTGFAGKTITSASLTGYCMSNEGPTLTITAGSATMLEDEPLVRQSSGTTDPAVYTTTPGSVSLGAGDALTFTINSTAHAGICLVGISVTYGEGGATGTFNLGSGDGVNTAGLEGEITVELGSLANNFNVGQMYSFDALIKTAASGNGAPRRVAGNGNYSIQAVGNVSGSDIATAVTDVRNAGEVAGVKYVNVAGQVSSTPWQGVNIVVTRMSDGTTRTAKVVK